MEQPKKPKFKGADDFASTNDFLAQFDEDGGLVEDYTEIEPEEWIHTGHYMFNAHISGSLRRGYPSGKIITIPGDPKTGKSYLVFNGMREAQKRGYMIWLFETEGAPDKTRFIKQGVDPKRVRITQPETVGEAIVKLVQFTTKLLEMKKEGKPIPKFLVSIDSLTSLNSQKQFDDAMAGETKADMGGQAKEIINMLNMLTVRLGKLQIPMINTMHVYEARDRHSNVTKTPSGGKGPLYMSSVVPMLRKTLVKDKETKQRLGVMVTSSIFESRYAQHHDIEMYINFEKGMNEFLGLEKYVSWEICGINKGKVVDFVDIGYELFSKKLFTLENVDKFEFTDETLTKNLSKPKLEFIKYCLEKSISEGLIVETNVGGKYMFTEKIKSEFDEKGKYKKPAARQIAVPNKTSNTWAIKHLDKAVPMQALFTKEVFTDKVIEELDEKVIMPKFMLSSIDQEEILNMAIEQEIDTEQMLADAMDIINKTEATND